MKKIYLAALFATISKVALSQGYFIPTDYRGAFAPSPVAQWTDQWTNFDPQNTVYPSATVNVTSSITNNTTWTANNVYLLQGQIYVKNGATLTIEPGTIVLGDKNTAGSGLFITQGSKLNANGTAANPIVFTSNQVNGQRALGDWGGIILMGRANNNQPGGIANIEGLAPTADTQYGGGTSPDDDDNSGVLKYVRIEFGGYVYQPNKEINGLTLGAIGRGTTIDNVQVSFSNDDAFEWFGGTVNCRHLVSYRNLDDDFDTDNGFSGNVQFGLVVRDPNLADNPSVSTSEGFESDNNAAGDASAPQTSAAFSNITLVGPLRGDINATVATGYRRGARLRRNTALKIYNTVYIDFLRGIHIDGTASESNANTGTSTSAVNNALKYKNNLIAGFLPTKSTEVNAGSTFDAHVWFGANSNDSLASSANILANPYGTGNDYISADFRPITNSPLLSNFMYTDAAISPMVLTAPQAQAQISYCVGETSTALTATATNGNTIKWYTVANGGTEIAVPTPVTTVAGTTVYFVAQAGMFGIEGPRTMVTVTVNANPTAPVVTASGSTSLCTGSSVTLTSDQTTNNTWSTAETTQSISVSTTGDYSVVFTDGNGCQATSNIISVTVSNAPTPTIQASGSVDICSGSSVTLTSSTADSYVWSTGATTQSIDVSVAGTYTVTTTNANSCDGVGVSNAIVVTVTLQPTASGTFVITNGNTVTFTNTSTNATSYSWDFGDFSSSSIQNPTHVYADFNTYTVTLVATNGNCSNTTTFLLDNLAVDNLSSDNQISFNLFPNPVSGNGTIELLVKENTTVSLSIVDNSGKLIQELANEALEAGKHSFNIDATTLQNGLYFVVLNNASQNKIYKMNVIK